MPWFVKNPDLKNNPDYLEPRVNDLESSLAEIASLELVADIADTTYKIGQRVDAELVRTRQAVLYAQFMQKLRALTPVQIACIGDSLTHGYDINSVDKRVSDAVVDADGVKDTTTIASATYPEKLFEFLNTIYNNKVTVIKRAMTGDWIKRAYTKWRLKHTSDLSIIMYGTNDVDGSWVPEDYRGKIDEYLKWYEQFIIREILWDKAVIILTPPKLKSANYVALDAYRNSLYLLGEKYGVPVIDAEEFMKNYTPDIYSDSTHFNGIGYTVFAAKVASLLIGEGLKNINRVGHGTKLLSRPTIDNLVYFGGAAMSVNAPTGTPNETDATQGIVANLPANGGIIYSFYAEKDDLLVFPYAYLSDGVTMKMELDFGVVQPQNSIDGAILKANGTESEPSAINYPKEPYNYSKDYVIMNNKAVMRIVADGWHTLKITAIGGVVVLNGVEFTEYGVLVNHAHVKGLVTDVNGAHGLKIESGNWTPKWGSSSDGVHTYSVQEGTYYKINKLVFARGILTMTTKDATMSGSYLAIKGLPFVPNKLVPVSISSAQNITLPVDKPRIFASASTSGNIALKAGDVSGADVALTATAITNTSSIEFSIVYEAV
jgi:lysophospholipase L1-like esterase